MSTEDMHLNEATDGVEPASASTGGPTKRVLRVWLVDDDDALRELFAYLLSQQPGLSCTRQFPSAEAILAALAEERPPDVVLLDINLGDKNGLDAIRPIKKLAPSVKVLMWTMFANERYEIEASKAGATGFLLKSYEPRQVAHIVHEAHGNAAAQLFPHLASGMAARLRLEPDKSALPAAGRAGRFSLIGALKELWTPRRQRLCWRR